ncbi:MAG: radical SAM protein [Thermodesulfobacteriota bacterium]|nr:radical SAM protein [Thermodesulfobacteriota bacterium]
MHKSPIEEFEIGPIRPPSEGGSYSLLLRFTRNCSWNRCTFCHGLHYDGAKLQLRSVEEIKSDIDKAKAIRDVIDKVSRELGFDGKINQDVAETLFMDYPEARFSASFVNVFNWLSVGGGTVFLQDANTLIMRTPDLVDTVNYLREVFPFVERITSYARAKTALGKSLDELKSLKNAGLSRLHIGLETGDDELLRKVHKGVTAEQHIKAGKKIVEVGMELSEYIMPGLGGKEMTEQHARNTALVLNGINPHFIRSRPLAPRPGTAIADEHSRGEFLLLSPHELLREIEMLIKALDVSSKLCFDHALNPRLRSGHGLVPLFDQSYEGYQLPEDKEHLLEIIEKGLRMDESLFPTPEEIARFSM